MLTLEEARTQIAFVNRVAPGSPGCRYWLHLAPTIMLALGGLPLERLKSASDFYTLMRSLGGAIGIGACSTILNDRTNLHFLRIAEHLNSANAQLNSWLHGMAARYAQAGRRGGDEVGSEVLELWVGFKATGVQLMRL